MKKRQSAVDLTDLAIGILILGITVFVGANLLLNLRDNRLSNLDLYNTQENIALNANRSITQDLSNFWVASITNCSNSSDVFLNASVGTGNFTISYNGDGLGTTSITTSAAGDAINLNGSTITCSYYSYNTSRADWALPNNAAVGVGEYGNWFDIIVIVGIASVILTLIFLAFGRGREEGGAGQIY